MRASIWLLRRSGALSPSLIALQRPELKLIQELRFRTDAPISDCNAALKECNLNLDEAAEWLRKKGIAKANKKEGRVTENGLVIAAVDRALGGGVIRLCSETDFASRNAHFSAAAAAVKAKMLELIAGSNGAILQNSEEALQRLTEATKDILASTIAVLGENIAVRGFTCVPLPDTEPEDVKQLPLAFGKYVHNSLTEADAGGIVGVVAVRNMSGSLDVVVLDDLAQHFVGSSGDTSNYVHQSFLGSKETVGQWLKKHNVKLATSMVLPFGKEPILTHPAVRPPPKV